MSMYFQIFQLKPTTERHADHLINRKVEVKSPPRKVVRPKRKSGVSENSESDKKEAVPASNNDLVEAQEQQQPGRCIRVYNKNIIADYTLMTAPKSEESAKEGVDEGANAVSA